MKVKTGVSYKEVLNKQHKKKKNPTRPSFLLGTLIRVLSMSDLKATHFKYKSIGMEKLGKNEPCFILMNHSSFIDLKIASKLLYPRKYNIIMTLDGFVGRDWLMRHIGCIPTRKFVSDVGLMKDMMYAVKRYNSSILMFPEAGYTFDGTATTLPDSLGRCIKMMDLPVVFIKTEGAFTRDPLYNNLQLRDVDVSATIEYLLSPEEIKEKKSSEINSIIKEKFTFDSFRWQKENGVIIDEPFRADSLNRLLYKCPHCLAEGETEGKGTTLTCKACGKVYEMLEDGSMKATSGETEISHIPDWYQWERECVRKEIDDGTYNLDIDVKICAIVDTDYLYDLGDGHLTHNRDGIHLTGCDGELDYMQKPLTSYTLNSDFYWYKLGDIIGIGNNDILYYCFPKADKDVVTKARLATEELYKVIRSEKRNTN